MLAGNSKFTLTSLQKFFVEFFRNNLLTFLISVLATGVIGFNLWLLLNYSSEPPKETLISSSNFGQPEKGFGDVLSESTQAAILQNQVQVSQAAGKVTIALLGDSMVETLGDLKNLTQALAQYYPAVEFNLLNYGIGATKPENGLARLTETTTTQTKNLPSLLSQNPDIVILESFSYNHEKNSQEDISSHYQVINQIIQKLKQEEIITLFLLTIAPSQNYAQNAPGILWDENQQKLEAQTIIEYLKVGLKFTKENNFVLMDAFTPSLDKNGFGKQIYVNSGDNIHPSQEGVELISDLISQKIFSQKIIEKALKD